MYSYFEGGFAFLLLFPFCILLAIEWRRGSAMHDPMRLLFCLHSGVLFCFFVVNVPQRCRVGPFTMGRQSLHIYIWKCFFLNSRVVHFTMHIVSVIWVDFCRILEGYGCAILRGYNIFDWKWMGYLECAGDVPRSSPLCSML